MTAALLGALLLGLAGSVHCAVMCGPLVALMQPRGWRGAIAYHAGRIAIYAGLGAAAGGLGLALTGFGLGRGLALIAAALLVAEAVAMSFPLGRGARASRQITQWLGRVAAWLRARRTRAPLVFGVVNGLLPCGLVYGALTASIGLAGPVEGALTMTAFGVGTTPLLLIASRSAGALARRLPVSVRRLAPAALVLLALLLIGRGLSTGSAVIGHHH
ncbi:MAG TPA: sulfite exporter TauE/SafE family protein [Vicinamibacterales bacterium]|nr:sulfite exporter TauE/SafE family protein [Vicinamibacterales bacterium]